MRAWALIACLCLAQGADAQQEAARGTGAVLRSLEKVNGQVTDYELANGASQESGRITVTLRECRYPVGNQTGEAYAYLSVSEKNRDTPVFEGWMIASSPGLSAMEHPRYDVWVLRCKTE